MHFVSVVVLNAQNKANIQAIGSSLFCKCGLAILLYQVNELIENDVVE